ncbi:MAG: hypothetical protein ACJ787_01115 [Myxococcales bacterium]
MTEIKPSPDHRRALEARLLARYDQLHPQPKEMPMQTFARRHATQLAFAAVLAIALGAAAQAPAQLTKQVGTRVEIETAASIDSADLRKAIESLQEEPQGGFGGPERRAREVLVRRIRTSDGARLQIDLFGDALRADAEQRLRAALPQLRDATVRISAIDASVETSVAGKLAFDLLGREPSGLSAEELKRRVQEQLRAAGETGDVDVKVDEEGGKRRVEVRVKKDQTR